MLEIDPLETELNTEMETKSTNYTNLSPDHQSSILFQTDVTNTQTTLNDLKTNFGDVASQSCERCANFAKSAISTKIKEMESNLVSLSGSISSALDTGFQDVIKQITEASNLVYTEKKVLYTENDNRIENQKSSFDVHCNAFKNDREKYKIAKDKYDSLKNRSDLTDAEQDEKDKAKDTMDSSERSMERHYSDCKGYLSLIKQENIDNNKLLEEFLKNA